MAGSIYFDGGWYNFVNPYIKNGTDPALTFNSVGTKGVWHCPDDKNPGLSYAANANIFGGGTQIWAMWPSTSIAQMDKPADLVVVGEVVGAQAVAAGVLVGLDAVRDHGHVVLHRGRRRRRMANEPLVYALREIHAHDWAVQRVVSAAVLVHLLTERVVIGLVL